MNRKVIETSLVLTIIYLLAWYVLKIFFPDWFLLQVNNDKLIKLGEMIDSNLFSMYGVGIITSFITYWLYLGAVCHKKMLKIRECIIVIAVYIVSVIVEVIDVNFAVYFSILMMIILPAIMGAKLKDVAIVFSFHLICQFLSMSIRQLSTKLIAFNTVIAFVIGLESYFWLLLFYLLNNYFDTDKGGIITKWVLGFRLFMAKMKSKLLNRQD